MIKSKSQKTKKIILTDDKRIFCTKVKLPEEESNTPVKNINPLLDNSLENSSNKKKSIQKKDTSFEYKIGNYLIQKTLGQGTFGKVKLGIYLPNQEKVAIKILEKDRMTDKDDQIRIKREFDMLSKFNHPNVILVTEIFESIDSYYSVMEYCEGGELFNYIVEKRRLSENESSFFYFQIINGLEYIHSLGIVHRDLKPENLLLTKDHLLKIIDFGLSNYFEKGQKNLLSTPCGSPCYASPEMVAGKKYDGIKIDIWSTGIILFAMLCGYLPFEDKNNEILFDKILECKIDFPYFLSEESIDLIKKILVIDPLKRIDICDIKKHSFFLKGKKFFEQIFTIKQIIMDDNNLETKNDNNDNNNKNNNNNDNIKNNDNNNKNNENESKNNNNIIENEKIKDLNNNKFDNEIDVEIKENKLIENKENNINIENININENIKIDKNKNERISIEKTNNYQIEPTLVEIKNDENKNINSKEKNKLPSIKNTEIKNKSKKNKNIKKSKDLSKYLLHLEKKKKVEITDNGQNIINNKNILEVLQKNNYKKIVHKTPVNKNEKKLRQKEIIIDKNKLIDSLTKERNTIGSISSFGSSVLQNLNTTSHHTNITNLMFNNINYNVNISFENTKRTYSHENTKDDIIQNDVKNNINKTSFNYLSHNTTSKNSNNINIIEYGLNKNSKKNFVSNNCLFYYYNYNNKKNKNDKIIKNKPNRIKKNLKEIRASKNYHNSDNIRQLKQELDFNICKYLINDSHTKKNYKEFLTKKCVDTNISGKNENRSNKNNIISNGKNSRQESSCKNYTVEQNSKSKNKDKKYYTNRINLINDYYNLINKENNISNDNRKIYLKKLRNYKKLNIKSNKNFKDKSLNKNKNLSTINTHAKTKSKKLIIMQSNLINKNAINKSKNNIKFKCNNFFNQTSMDIEMNSLSIQTEPNLKNGFISVINKINKNSKSKLNSKINMNINNCKRNKNFKYSVNTLRKKQMYNYYKKDNLSFLPKVGINGEKPLKYNINQTIDNSHKKQFETINNFISNFKMYNPDLVISSINKSNQKNISKKDKKPFSSYIKDEISNKLIEQTSNSIEFNKDNKDSFFRPQKSKFNHFDNFHFKNEKFKNISSVSSINNLSNNETLSNYLKITDRTININNGKSNSKSKGKENKDNKENKKSKNEKLVSCENEKDHEKNKMLKMNKFRKICLKSKDEINNIKNNICKKYHIRTIKKISNIKNDILKIKKNKTEDNLGIVKRHIVCHSTGIYNENSNLLYRMDNHLKFNSMKLTNIYKNNIKNRNKVKKVFLIDKKKENRTIYKERNQDNNKSKKEEILINPSLLQRHIISIKNYDKYKKIKNKKYYSEKILK